MDLHRLTETLKRHEGVRRSAYTDSLGYLTIGVGRLIDARKGGGLSDDEISYLLSNDIDRAWADAASRIKFFGKLTDLQQEALVNMVFQMGIGKVLEFKRMLAALEAGDLDAVRNEAADSLWSRQTPGRSHEVISMLCRGAA